MTVHEHIEAVLSKDFAPVHLEVSNESDGHNVAPGSETHFKVVIVSDHFTGQRAVQRHRLVYQALADDLRGPVHALALHTFTPSEWQDTNNVPVSPACLGGEKPL